MSPQNGSYYFAPQDEKDKILAPAKAWWARKAVWFMVVVAVLTAYPIIWNSLNPGYLG